MSNLTNLLIFSLIIAISHKGNCRPLTAIQRNQIALDCIEEVGILRSVIEDAMLRAHYSKKLPTDEKYKTFLACSYKKQGYMSEDGEILIDNLKEFLSEFYDTRKVSEIDACKVDKGVNDGETAFTALECVLAKLSNMKSQKEDSDDN